MAVLSERAGGREAKQKKRKREKERERSKSDRRLLAADVVSRFAFAFVFSLFSFFFSLSWLFFRGLGSARDALFSCASGRRVEERREKEREQEMKEQVTPTKKTKFDVISPNASFPRSLSFFSPRRLRHRGCDQIGARVRRAQGRQSALHLEKDELQEEALLNEDVLVVR